MAGPASCPVSTFMEQNPAVTRPRAPVSSRAIGWAIGQLRRESASIQALARQLGCTWRTLWYSIRPVGQGGRGLKEFTGMVGLTRDDYGRVRARLLDLVPGRSGQAYRTWLAGHGAERLAGRQRTRLHEAFAVDDRHLEVEVEVARQYHQSSLVEGRRITQTVVARFPTCPIPEIARLGRTPNPWRDPFLGYFSTDGGTESINGLIGLARRVVCGFRNLDNHRLRMLLTGGGPRV